MLITFMLASDYTNISEKKTNVNLTAMKWTDNTGLATLTVLIQNHMCSQSQ